MSESSKPVDLKTLAGHTPGPWRAEVYNLRMGSLISYGDLSKGETIAIAVAQRDIEVGKANARLIAAAPELWLRLVAKDRLIAELREALGQVLPYMEAAEKAGLIGDEGCHWPVEIVRAAVDAALAAGGEEG